MAELTVFRSGIRTKIYIPTTSPNNLFTNIAEIQVMHTGFNMKNNDGVTDMPDNSTLETFYGSSISKNEIWNTLAPSKTVSSITKNNVQIPSAVMAGMAYQPGQFSGNAIVEYSSVDPKVGGYVDINILAADGDVIYRSGTDANPTYDDAPGGTLITAKPIVFGTYFIRVKISALEAGSLASEWFYSTSISFNDFWFTDLGTGDHFIAKWDGTNNRLFSNRNPTKYINGSIIIDNGRKMAQETTNTTGKVGPTQVTNYWPSSPLNNQILIFGTLGPTISTAPTICLLASGAAFKMNLEIKASSITMYRVGATTERFYWNKAIRGRVATDKYVPFIIVLNTNSKTLSFSSSNGNMFYWATNNGMTADLYFSNALTGELDGPHSTTLQSSISSTIGINGLFEGWGPGSSATCQLINVGVYTKPTYSLSEISNLFALLKKIASTN